MFKKLSTVLMAVIFLSMFCIGLKTVHAETFNDLTVKGDARFQYPIYADGGLIQFGGGDLRMLDFNQGSSRIYNQGDLYVVTDDNLYFNFSNQSSDAMATFDSRVTVNNNFNALFPIYAQGNEIVFNGSGVAVKTADSTPRIYRSSDTLRLMAPNMYLDVPGTLTIENDLTVGGDLQVTGTQTYAGNTTFGGTITVTGQANLNGNISGDADLTVTGATGANLVATTGTLDLTSSAGNTTITSTGATSDIILTAGDDMTLAVTGDYANTVGGTYLNTVTGTYGIDATGALTIDSAGSFSIDGADASNMSLASAGDADDLTIAVTGATNSSLVLASSGTAADALTISTSAGGMDITVAGAAAGEDLDISSNSSINLTSTEAAVTDAIKLSTAADSSIFIDAGTTDKTADAMHFDVDVNSASVDGISMDVDVATALSAGEIANGINIDVDGNAGDDAGSYVNGLFVTSANTSAGVTSGILLSGAFDYFLNVAPTTNSNELVNITMAANPNSTKAMNINTAVTTASGTVTGLSVDLTSLDANGQNVYNLWLESPTAGAGNEYGIYLNGTSWDYSIYSDDNIRFGNGQNQTLDVAQSAAGVAGKSLTVTSGAGGTATGAGLAGGAINIKGGAGSNAVVDADDGGDGGNIVLTPGSGGDATGLGAGEDGDDGDIYLDGSEYIVFGGTTSALGDMKYDMIDGSWSRYVENPATFNVAISGYDAVKFVDSGDAGYDNTKVGRQVIKEAGDGESHRFAGIADDDGIAVGANGWITVYGVAGEDDTGIVGPTDGDADAAAGDGFVLDGTAGAIRKTVAATDESCGYFVEKNGASDAWIVFVRAM